METPLSIATIERQRVLVTQKTGRTRRLLVVLFSGAIRTLALMGAGIYPVVITECITMQTSQGAWASTALWSLFAMALCQLLMLVMQRVLTQKYKAQRRLCRGLLFVDDGSCDLTQCVDETALQYMLQVREMGRPLLRSEWKMCRVLCGQGGNLIEI